MNTLKYDNDTIYLEIPKDRYLDFLEATSADLFLNESWALDKYDFLENEKLFKTVMTDELYNRLTSLFLTGQKRFIELMRSSY